MKRMPRLTSHLRTDKAQVGMVHLEHHNFDERRAHGGIQQQLFPYVPKPESQTGIEPKGVIYTKRWVVDLILDLAGYRTETNLVDRLAVEPAAGDGAFLGPMIERLVNSCRQLGRPITDCKHSLLAYEINGESARRARAACSQVLRGLGVDDPLAENLAAEWLRVGDYLLERPVISADFFIGNPPYIRLEDIPSETAAQYREIYATMRGRADLYVAFYESALRNLNNNGACAFICADRWMRNQYGAELRRLITSAFSVDVIVEMHGADAFHQEVDAYPAIAIIRKHGQQRSVIASAIQAAEDTPATTLSQLVEATGRGEPLAMPQGFRAALVHRWFKGSDPWPCHSPEQLALLRRLEESFAELESTAKVGIGVATGNDRLFITKDPDLVERPRLLKLAMARDIADGEMEWSGRYLVDPWNCDGLVGLSEFPRLKRYFDRNAVELKKRHTATKNPDAWYRTIDRVTHSLLSEPKLYIADIKETLNPVLDRGETYPHHNLYFVHSKIWDLEVLGGILISAVGQFFVESYGVRMRGGYLRFQAQYLKRIRLPDPGLLTDIQSQELAAAFRSRDRVRATTIALEVYGIQQAELESALGY
jgi:adenine-specific DNA-methyltransferase